MIFQIRIYKKNRSSHKRFDKTGLCSSVRALAGDLLLTRMINLGSEQVAGDLNTEIERLGQFIKVFGLWFTEYENWTFLLRDKANVYLF